MIDSDQSNLPDTRQESNTQNNIFQRNIINMINKMWEKL